MLKTAIFIIALSIIFIVQLPAQVVKGVLVDSKTHTPLNDIYVVNSSSLSRGTAFITDSTGRFEMKPERDSVIRFTGPGYLMHAIISINSSNDTIDLGEIGLVEGVVGYAMTNRRCRHIDTSKKLKPKDLIVLCEDGKVRYTWKKDGHDANLWLNYNEIVVCGK